MAFKFAYAGAEIKPRVVFKAPPEDSPRNRHRIANMPRDIVADLRPLDLPAMPDSLRAILLDVGQKLNIHPNDIVGRGRTDPLVEARREFVWRARHETHYSFPRIGRAMNRDHTTALYHYHYMQAWHNNEEPQKKVEARERSHARLENLTELTERQRKVRGFIIRGYKNPEIAVEMGLSISAIKHDRRAIKKLHPLPEIYYRNCGS